MNVRFVSSHYLTDVSRYIADLRLEKVPFCVFNLSISFSLAPTEPLLCKFADGGQKKRQSQNKYVPNGRAWAREGEARLVSSGNVYFACIWMLKPSRLSFFSAMYIVLHAS